MSTCQTSGWSHNWWWENWGLTTLVPSPGSPHSHWFPVGSGLPDQGQASDTNEFCSPLYTVGTTNRDHLQFVSTSPYHILLHHIKRNAIKTIFCPDQCMHILPPSIWCITTPRYYLCRTTFITTNRKCYGKNKRSAWPEVWLNVNLTQSLILGDIWPEVNLPEVVTHLATRCLSPGGMSNQKKPDQIITLVHKMSLVGGSIWPKVSLTQRSEKCQPNPKHHLGGPSDQRSTWLK